VAVNCAGVTETLLESQLFGHVKGAFTDAFRDKVGMLQQAQNGTIFLDEVAEMSLRMQSMFLRILENGEIQPVGSDVMKTQVNVRVIAATRGNYQAVVRLFGMPDTDYTRFLNFLGPHGCVVDFRDFRAPPTQDGTGVNEHVLPEASAPRGGRAGHLP